MPPANERRAGFGLYSDPTSVPGLVMDAVGFIYLVKPDGSRCLLDCGGGAGNTPLPSGVGDMLYSLDGATWTILPIGAQDEVLTVDTGVPAWEPGGTSVVAGDALAFTGTTLDVLVDGVTLTVNGLNQLEVISGGVLSNAVIIDPATDARNVIQPTLATVIPLTLRGQVGQSDRLMSLEDSGSNVLTFFDQRGFLSIGDALNGSALDVKREVVGTAGVFFESDTGMYVDVEYTSPDIANPPSYTLLNVIYSKYKHILRTATHTPNASGLLVQMDMDAADATAIGGASPDISTLIVAAKTTLANTQPTGDLIGISSQTQHFAASTLETMYAYYMSTYIGPGTGLVSYVNEALIGYAVDDSTTGTIPTWLGIDVGSPYLTNAGRTITNFYGLRVTPYGGAGKITNWYGLRLNAPVTAQVTGLRYAILSTGGSVEFRSNLATDIMLTVRGAAVQSADLVQLQSSAAAILTRFSSTGTLGFGLGVNPANYGGWETQIMAAKANDSFWSANNSGSYDPFVTGLGVAPIFVDAVVSPTGNVPTLSAYGMASAVRLGAVDKTFKNIVGIYAEAYYRGTKAAGSGQQIANLRGAEIWSYDSPAATGDIGQMQALNATAQYRSAGVIGGGVYGMSMIAQTSALNVGTSAIPFMGAGYFSVVHLTATRLVTDATGVYVTQIGQRSNVVTSYAIHIENQAAQASQPATAYSIVSEGGMSLLKAGAATVIPLTLRGFAAQSGSYLRLEDSALAAVLQVTAAGVIQFGSAADTNLYRSAADTLKTDDSLVIGAALNHIGSIAGFLNATPVVQQSASTLTALWTALKNYGLLTGGSASPGDISDAVILAPTTSARNVIQPTGATVVPLTVKGFTAQSGNLLQLQSSAAATLLAIKAAGNYITTPTTELILEQTGDVHGATLMRLRSRDGETGAIFENPALDLMDVILRPSSGSSNQRLIRLEARASECVVGDPELQLGYIKGVAGKEIGSVIIADNETLARSLDAAKVPFRVRGFTAQTALLQEWGTGSATGVQTTTLGVLAGGALEMLEQTDPATPAANKVRLYSRDSGGGLTQLVARFPSGNTVVVAEDF